MVPEARPYVASEGGKREQGEAGLFNTNCPADALAAPATVSGEAWFHDATVVFALFERQNGGKAEQSQRPVSQETCHKARHLPEAGVCQRGGFP